MTNVAAASVNFGPGRTQINAGAGENGADVVFSSRLITPAEGNGFDLVAVFDDGILLGSVFTE